MLPTRPAIFTISVVWLGRHIILGVCDLRLFRLILRDHDIFLIRFMIGIVIGPIGVVPGVFFMLWVLVGPLILVPFLVPNIGAALG